MFKNVLNDAYFKRTVCKIGGINVQSSILNAETLYVKLFIKDLKYEPREIDIACLEHLILFSMLSH